MSLPSWECGLKYWKRSKRHRCNRVTPFVGVWIEIHIQQINSVGICVTLFVGVWIEILGGSHNLLPTIVTPFVGVWIEIFDIIER